MDNLPHNNLYYILHGNLQFYVDQARNMTRNAVHGIRIVNIG